MNEWTTNNDIVADLENYRKCGANAIEQKPTMEPIPVHPSHYEKAMESMYGKKPKVIELLPEQLLPKRMVMVSVGMNDIVF